MQHWVILSGKGGTGKTTVAASIAHVASADARLVLADADVDAANLELLLDPTPVETHNFVGGRKACIDDSTCTGCGLCAEVCRFDAVAANGDTYVVDPIACEGCAACHYSCPSRSIAMLDSVSGTWSRSDTLIGPLFHARLTPGESNSGKLVSQVKQAAVLAAAGAHADLLIVDGPPGIGCPALAAVTGAHLVLIVTEPTVSGAHDLERVVGLARHFRIPAAVCINKADVNPDQAAAIAAKCTEEGLPLMGSIPFDEAVMRATVSRRPVTAVGDGPASMAIRQLWEALRRRLIAPATGGGEP